MTTQAPSELLPNEVAEVERHKYFLSEKAGYDVGWEHAEADWLAHHAEQFRTLQPSECAEQTTNCGSVDQVADSAIASEPSVRPSVSSTRGPGRLGYLIDRLLSRSRND